MSFIQTERGRFFYQETGGGTGPLVYLLHGLTAQSWDWATIPEDLAEAGFHVFAFDMKGHGQSDKPEKGYSPEDHAEDIEACSKTLGHCCFHVVGHSTGGRNALFYAWLFPKKVFSLTIVDQTLTADPDESNLDFVKAYARYPTPFVDEASLDQFLLKQFPDRERRRRFEKGRFTQRQDGQWDWSFSISAALETQRLGRVRAIHNLLDKVQCPILFFKGADSSYIAPEESRQISGLLPPGSFVVIEKAGHGVFRDNPQAFLGCLVPFLRSASPF